MPLAAPVNSTVRRHLGEAVDRSDVKSFMLAEYAMLRELRQHIVSVGEHRVNVFLATVSGSAVALALINQLSSLGRTRHVIIATILAGLLLLGLITFDRLVKRSVVMTVYTRGLNRVRRYFVDSYPEISQYIILPVHDDTPSFKAERFLQPDTGLAALVAVLNSTIAVADCVVLVKVVLEMRTLWALVTGAVVFLTFLLVQHRYRRARRTAAETKASILFPSAERVAGIS